MPDERIIYEIEVDARKLKRGELALRRFRKTARKEFKDADRAADTHTKKLGGITKGLIGIGAAYAALRVVQTLTRLTDEAITYENQIRTATERTGEFEAAMRGLLSISRTSATNLGANIAVFRELTALRPELGTNLEQELRFVDLIGRAGVISGASTEALGNSLRQLSQGLAEGVLRAEEYNSILSQTPFIIDVIAGGLGVMRGDMRSLVVEGKLYAEDILGAVFSQQNKIHRLSELQNKTSAQGFEVFKTARTELLISLAEMLGYSDSIYGFWEAIAGAVDRVRITLEAANKTWVVSALRYYIESGQYMAEMLSIVPPWAEAQKKGAVHDRRRGFVRTELGTIQMRDDDEFEGFHTNKLVAAAVALDQSTKALSKVQEDFILTIKKEFPAMFDLVSTSRLIYELTGKKAPLFARRRGDYGYRDKPPGRNYVEADRELREQAGFEVYTAEQLKAQLEGSGDSTEAELIKTNLEEERGLLTEHLAEKEALLAEADAFEYDAATEQGRRMLALLKNRHHLEQEEREKRTGHIMGENYTAAQATTNLFGGIAQQYLGFMTGIAAENKDKSEDAFRVWKKFAMAQAAVGTALGIVNVLATPFNHFLGAAGVITAASLVGALGAAQVSVISSQEFSPRRFGGPVSAGSGYLVGEDGAELFMPNSSGRIIPNNKMGGVNITVNNYSDSEVDVAGDEENIVVEIANAVQGVASQRAQLGYS